MSSIANIAIGKAAAVQPLPSILLGPGEGQTTARGAAATVKADFPDTAGVLAATELCIAPGQGVHVHCHYEADEVIYVLDGRLQVFQGVRVWEGMSGHTFQITAGTAHGIYNAGETPVRALVYHLAAGGAAVRALVSNLTAGAPDPVALTLGDARTVARAIVQGGGPAGVRSLAPDEGESYERNGSSVHFHLTGGATGGRLFLFEGLAEPGAGVPPHIHSREDELFYVVEGAVTLMLPDGTEIVAEAGSFLLSPGGTPHAWYNRSDRRTRMVTAATPAGFENFFRASQGASSPPQIVAIAAEYGIRFLPPQ